MLTKEQKRLWKNKSGIYQISNNITNKCYIGSSFDLTTRLRNHVNMLKKNKHHSIHLQNSYNKNGTDNFSISILEFCEESKLLEKEQYYLDLHKPQYNISLSSQSPMKGRKHSKKTLDLYKDRKPWNKGILRTEEEKNLMSQRKKEEWTKKTPEEKLAYAESHKKNPSKYWLGKKLPEYAVQKIQAHVDSLKEKIRCIQTGEIFDCQLDAAKKMNLRQGHISEHLNNKRASVKGFTFEKVKENVL
jgi:group I intron endonuclease